MLARIPRMPEEMADHLVAHYGSLEKLSRASVDELAAVDGLTEHWALTIKDALGRIAESSILDRYT